MHYDNQAYFSKLGFTVKRNPVKYDLDVIWTALVRLTLKTSRLSGVKLALRSSVCECVYQCSHVLRLRLLEENFLPRRYADDRFPTKDV